MTANKLFLSGLAEKKKLERIEKCQILDEFLGFDLKGINYTSKVTYKIEAK